MREPRLDGGLGSGWSTAVVLGVARWCGGFAVVAITAPPVDGQANAHLIKFIAKQFRVAKSQVIIEKGELGRHKQIKIVNPQQIPPEVATLLE